MALFANGRSLREMLLCLVVLCGTAELSYSEFDPPRILVALKTVDGGDLPDSLAQKREYYISKGFQLVGLLVIGVGFINKFPQLMDYKLLGIGLVFFIMGVAIQKFGLS